MKAGSGQHFEQAYNAQAAVDETMLIVGARVSVAANDKQELEPTVAAISPGVGSAVNTILVDSGFYSEAAVQRVEVVGSTTPLAFKQTSEGLVVTVPAAAGHEYGVALKITGEGLV